MKSAQKIRKKKLGSAVYLLPNMLTTGNLFFGFFSIVKSISGDYTWAAGAILLASVFDVLDGRVARLTNSTSEFGVQYDSLCDLVSFGLAPSLAIYFYSLEDVGRFGWIACFLFLACGALRLARFNVQSSIGESQGSFTGLPIPMAAGSIASLIYLLQSVRVDVDYALYKPWFAWLLNALGDKIWLGLATCYVGMLAFLMVSNFSFRSHKKLKFTAVKPFMLLVLSVVFVAFVAYEPALLGFLLFLSYALSGPVEWLLGRTQLVDEDDIFENLSEEDSSFEPHT